MTKQCQFVHRCQQLLVQHNRLQDLVSLAASRQPLFLSGFLLGQCRMCTTVKQFISLPLVAVGYMVKNRYPFLPEDKNTDF